MDAWNALPKWTNSIRLKHHPGRRLHINDTDSNEPSRKPTPNNVRFRYVASPKRGFNLSNNFDIWERIFGLQWRSVAQAALCSPSRGKATPGAGGQSWACSGCALEAAPIAFSNRPAQEINTFTFLPVLCLYRAHHVLIASSRNKPSTGLLVQHTTHTHAHTHTEFTHNLQIKQFNK